MDLDRLRALADGPPPALPAWFDRIAERFGRMGPRPRLGVAAVGILVVVLLGTAADREPYGPEVAVMTVNRPVPAGTTVTDADVTTVRWPAGLLPADVVTALPGTTALRLLRPGQPVTGDAVAAEGVAALVRRADAVAYPLPADVAPDAAVGTLLDLLGTRPAGGGVRLAAGARVLARGDDVVWCEVGRDEAPALAGAAAFGRLVAVLVPAAG